MYTGSLGRARASQRKPRAGSLDTVATPAGLCSRPLVVRITSSTHHLSQIALRELLRRIRQELPDLPQENLHVDLGAYGAFDVRAGDTLLCEASRTVTYPAVADIVAQLARIVTAAAASGGSDPPPEDEPPDQQQLAGADDATWESAGTLGESSRSSSSSMTSLDFLRKPSEVHSLLSPDGMLVGEDLTDLVDVDADVVDNDPNDNGGRSGRGGRGKGIGISIGQIGLGKDRPK